MRSTTCVNMIAGYATPVVRRCLEPERRAPACGSRPHPPPGNDRLPPNRANTGVFLRLPEAALPRRRAVALPAVAGVLAALRGRAGVVAGAVFLALLLFVGMLPQSNELRYYLFLPLAWAAAIGMLFPEFRAAMPRLAAAFLVVVFGLFGYMVSENAQHYRIAKAGYAEAAAEYGATQWWPKLRPGTSYCAVDMMPFALMLTGPTMSEFRIVDRSVEALCPDDTVVLTRDGAERRKGEAAAPATGRR